MDATKYIYRQTAGTLMFDNVDSTDTRVWSVESFH